MPPASGLEQLACSTKELVFNEEYSGGPCANFTFLAVEPYKTVKQQHNAIGFDAEKDEAT